MSYFKLENKINELKHFAEHGLTDVKKTGISVLDGYFMLKKGYPLFIAGEPFSGKTEFCLEVQINTSILYNWKHFIYCGEGGNVEHIFSELCHKYLQKPYKYADEKERIKAEYFINEHFVIADHDKDYKVDDFLDLVQQAEDELKVKFDTTMFDPFNDMIDETDKFGGRDDKYLAWALKKIRKSSKVNNRIDILVNHTADVKPIQDKDTGRFYTRPALPSEWAGGKTWWRRAFTMIVIYRPPTFLKDSNGIEFKENETHVIIQKAKPKGIGKKGTISIFWDWKKNRYYCNVNGQDLMSCETLQDYNKTLPINTSFTDETPF